MVDPNLSPGDWIQGQVLWIQGQVLKWHTGLDQDGGGVTTIPGPLRHTPCTTFPEAV